MISNMEVDRTDKSAVFQSYRENEFSRLFNLEQLDGPLNILLTLLVIQWSPVDKTNSCLIFGQLMKSLDIGFFEGSNDK